MTSDVTEDTGDAESTEVVVAPAKALRLADMIDTLVKEIHQAPIDEEARVRFIGLYHATLIEVGSTLSDKLLEELARLQTMNITEASSCDELRLAMTQVEGWLQGVILGVLTGRTMFEDLSPSNEADSR
jgi:hypothetical protein